MTAPPLRASGARGASVFEYALVLVGAIAVALVGASAVGGSSRDVAHWESGCVKTFDCAKTPGSGGSASIAPESRDGAAATASEAWSGIRGELATAAGETVDAALQPADVLRGAGFLVDHPGAGFRALLGRRKKPSATSTESAGQSGARVATSMSPAVVGRLARIGKIMGAGAKKQQWAELDALAEGEDWQP